MRLKPGPWRHGWVDTHKGNFTGVARIENERTVRPFKAQALETPGWRTIGQADTRAAAEAIARGYRIDHRGTETRITEQRRPGGFSYIAR